MSLETKIKERLDEDVEVTFSKIGKNNGSVRYGCSIRKAEQAIAPVIYYDPTRNEDEIVNFIVTVYNRAGGNGVQFEAICRELLTSKDAFLANVMPALVNTAKNNLDGFVSVPYHDLSIIFKCKVVEGATFRVRSELLEHLGVSAEELFRAALANLEKSWKIVSYSELPGARLFFDLDVIEQFPMFILTTEDQLFGASAMLSSAALNGMAERLGCTRFYILPSSVHEVICMPVWDDKEDTGHLISMVKNINAEVVDPVDVLSDSVYMYEGGEVHVAV